MARDFSIRDGDGKEVGSIDCECVNIGKPGGSYEETQRVTKPLESLRRNLTDEDVSRLNSTDIGKNRSFSATLRSAVVMPKVGWGGYNRWSGRLGLPPSAGNVSD